MSLNLDEKKAVVDEVSAKVGLAQTVVLAEYRGIEVSELTKLRANARSQGVYLRVIKNTLFKRAVKGTVFSDLVSEMNGPLIYAISEDAISAAKVLNEFSKKNEKLKIKAGNYAGSLLTNIDVSDLANIPSKEILISQLLGLMQSPISSLARVISLIASKKESESN